MQESDSIENIRYPWVPDLGNGTYKNPIICADYSDPDVIRVGDDYYMVASSFNCTPGLPILHSRDLVNWNLINHALKNVPGEKYFDVQPGCGVWAPAIRFHDNKYWIVFPTPDEGFYVTTANHPAEQWSEPHLLQAGKGLIDPAPFWDEDGKAYVVHAYAGSRAGIKHLLRVCPTAPDCSQLIGEGEIVYNNPEKHPTLEGPKLHKRNGWYYISAPAGGVQNGWQVILRSRNIYGPYEDKIVLAQGNSNINGPHQGALVDTPQGDWWFVHFQDADVYGRILHLQPVRWEDDWPLIGINQNENGVGEPVIEYEKPIAGNICIPQTSDDFQSPELGLQWQWNANHYDDWYSLSENPGHLRLYPQPANPDIRLQPNLLLQKFPARSFTVETKLKLHSQSIGESAGLVIAGETQFMLGIESADNKNIIVLNVNNEKQIIAETQKSQLTLKAQVTSGGQFTFSYCVDNVFISLSQTFLATKGTWIGARVGLYSIKPENAKQAGYAEFENFIFS